MRPQTAHAVEGLRGEHDSDAVAADDLDHPSGAFSVGDRREHRTGNPLTPFELISARAFASGHSLRDLWGAALEAHPILADFDVEPYYVVQCDCPAARCLLPTLQRRDVLNLDAADIAREWDNACADTASAVQLLRNECGVFVSKWLPYRPMLIPLAAAWRIVDSASGPEHGARRAKLKRWFWCTSFKGEYESSSTTPSATRRCFARGSLAGTSRPSYVRPLQPAEPKLDPNGPVTTSRGLDNDECADEHGTFSSRGDRI